MRSLFIGILLLAAVVVVFASSHGEAPGIVNVPPVDSSDLYAFMSYETGRAGYVTVLACYNPLQKPFAGPNYYQFSNQHFYEILVDHRGTGKPSTIFQFQVNSELSSTTGIRIPIGFAGDQRMQSVPLKAIGALAVDSTASLNWFDTYKVRVFRGSSSRPTINPRDSTDTFTSPFANAGSKTIPDYAAYSNDFIYDVNWPINCPNRAGKVFVGQRKDPFYIYLGGVFDLVNFIPIEGVVPGQTQNAALLNHIRGLNVGVFAIEIHKDCLLLNGNNGVLGFWTRVRARNARGIQRSRLGNPLVNELFIGIDQKNFWNKVTPDTDKQFDVYIEYPTFPKLIDILFLSAVKTVPGFENVQFLEPQSFPRTDLLQVFHRGIPGLNELPNNTVSADLLRLNTNIAPVPYADQNALGVIANDQAGFPNGRRPKDDIVDIALRAAMGVLLNTGVAPIGQTPLTDFVPPTDTDYIDTFPYIALPIAGNVPNSN